MCNKFIFEGSRPLYIILCCGVLHGPVFVSINISSLLHKTEKKQHLLLICVFFYRMI